MVESGMVDELNSFQIVTRQVCNLFQEPVEQPLLGFRIAEEKTDRLNILHLKTRPVYTIQIR